jgi:hypothetical protein
MLTRFVRKTPGNFALIQIFLNLSALGNGSVQNDDYGYDEIRNLLSDRFIFSHGADIIRLIRASHVACNHACLTFGRGS